VYVGIRIDYPAPPRKNLRNTLMMDPDGNRIASSYAEARDTFSDPVVERRSEVLAMVRGMEDKTTRFAETFPASQALAKLQSLRVAIKVKGAICFIHLGDVVAIEAQRNYVLLKRTATSHLLRDSISVLAEKLEPYGLIRIHRSVLVNAAFVEGIKLHATGEYGLQIKGGKEYIVTRTYKRNLKLLAKFWIGTGGFFSD
jgi:DNA-binding LytR/AlgR family response regulator